MNNSNKANAMRAMRKERKEERNTGFGLLNKVKCIFQLREEDFDEDEYFDEDEEQYLDEEEEDLEEDEREEDEIIDLDDEEFNFLNKVVKENGEQVVPKNEAAEESEKFMVKKVNDKQPTSKKKVQAPEEKVVVKKTKQPASKKAEKPTIISDWKVFAPGTLTVRSMAGNELVRKVGSGEQISVVLKGTEQPMIISLLKAASFGDYIKVWTDKEEVLYLES